MLRTNSKKAMENIKKEIMDSYEAANEYYTFEGREAKTDFNDICADILEAFRIEKLEKRLLLHRRQSKQKRNVHGLDAGTSISISCFR